MAVYLRFKGVQDYPDRSQLVQKLGKVASHVDCPLHCQSYGRSNFRLENTQSYACLLQRRCLDSVGNYSQSGPALP
jgi:hypothetical protein